MKILILFQYDNHNKLIDNLGSELVKKGLSVASFNVVSFRHVCYSNLQKPWWVHIMQPLLMVPKLRGILALMVKRVAIINICKSYDYIDIHVLDNIYDDIIPLLIKQNKKVKFTIWGSDFFKATPERKEEQRILYKMADTVQVVTEQMRKIVTDYFPEIKEKTKVADFGNSNLANIKKQLSKKESNSFREAFNIPHDKIIIALGTNASDRQRHTLLLDNFSKLNTALKDKIFLMIPMNYGGNTGYINSVREKADSTSIPFVIITEFMPKDEFAKMVVACDIVITIQVTDSLSAALQEFLYAGSILIAGDWLPYEIYRDNGIYYRTVSLESLMQTTEDTILNFESIKLKCEHNQENIFKLTDWSHAIDKWVNIYRSK